MLERGGDTKLEESYRILLVEPHPVVRCGLRNIISAESDLTVVGEADTARSALTVLEEQRPGLVILELALPGESGIGLVKQMAQIARVLVFSALDELLYAERALTAGASGYVGKHERIDTLLEAVRSVMQGRVFASRLVTDRMLHRVTGLRRNTECDSVTTLSDRELEVFRMIGRGLGTREIAAALHLSRKTIETHRENIKKKLNVRNGNELVVRATSWLLER